MYTILLFTEDDDVRQRVAPPFPYCSLMYTILLFTEDDDADKSEFFRLKRRFKRDDEKSRVYFAKQNIRLQQMREVNVNMIC
jgi:aminoglycoside N3'-acetyltransferase